MDEQHPEPVTPATTLQPTKPAGRVVKIADYLGSVSGYARSLRARRVLTRTGKTIDADTLKRAPELVPKRGSDYARIYYMSTEGGLVAIPAPTPPLPSNGQKVMKWILARAAEPSSWRGFLMLLGVAGWALTDQQSESLMALGMALAGAIGIFFADPQSEQ